MANKNLEGIGQEIFESRYAYPGETKWADRAKVIARTVASAECDEEKEKIEKSFYDVIGSGDFIPGGRIIFGAGRNRGHHNLLNCYVIIPEDSVDSIGKTVQDMYRISCAGGGVGFNVSKIRPKGDHIGSVPNSAPGAVSVLKMINEVGEHVRAGKNRRTALMGILNITHPDLLEFLSVKLDQGELNNFNISVAITDRYLEAVELDEDWYFTFNNKEYHTYALNRISKQGVSSQLM
jgi:ribonucleoside-diphosphate reductase alpha chain